MVVADKTSTDNRVKINQESEFAKTGDVCITRALTIGHALSS